MDHDSYEEARRKLEAGRNLKNAGRPAKAPPMPVPKGSRVVLRPTPGAMVVKPSSSARHPVVARTSRFLRSRVFDHEGETISSENVPARLDVWVGPEQVKRALKLCDSLVAALASRKMCLMVTSGDEEGRSFVKLKGDEVDISLREPRGDDDGRRGWTGTMKLEASVGYIREFIEDQPGRPLEGRMSEFIGVIGSVALKGVATRKTRDDRRNREEIQRRKEDEAIRQNELKSPTLIRRLEGELANHRKVKEIRDYLACIRAEADRRGIRIGPKTELGQWLEWAEEYASKINPIPPLFEAEWTMLGKRRK